MRSCRQGGVQHKAETTCPGACAVTTEQLRCLHAAGEFCSRRRNDRRVDVCCVKYTVATWRERRSGDFVGRTRFLADGERLLFAVDFYKV